MSRGVARADRAPEALVLPEAAAGLLERPGQHLPRRVLIAGHRRQIGGDEVLHRGRLGGSTEDGVGRSRGGARRRRGRWRRVVTRPQQRGRRDDPDGDEHGSCRDPRPGRTPRAAPGSSTRQRRVDRDRRDGHRLGGGRLQHARPVARPARRPASGGSRPRGPGRGSRAPAPSTSGRRARGSSCARAPAPASPAFVSRGGSSCTIRYSAPIRFSLTSYGGRPASRWKSVAPRDHTSEASVAVGAGRHLGGEVRR